MEYISCVQCALQRESLFCHLPSPALEAFEAIKSVMTVPGGTVLFREGDAASGVFVLCDVRATLYISSDSGKRLVLRVAVPGEVLGLSASLCSGRYEITAEMLEQGRVAFAEREHLMRFLRDHRDASLQVVNLLSHELHDAYARVRSIPMKRHLGRQTPSA